MAANIYESVKQALQDIVAPELKTIAGQIESLRIELRTEIKRLDEKIEGGLQRLDEKLEGGLQRLEEKIGGLKEQFELAINIHERLAALEAKIRH